MCVYTVYLHLQILIKITMIVANFLLAHFSGTPLWCLCKCVVLVFLIIGFCKSKKYFILRNQLIITPPHL